MMNITNIDLNLKIRISKKLHKQKVNDNNGKEIKTLSSKKRALKIKQRNMKKKYKKLLMKYIRTKIKLLNCRKKRNNHRFFLPRYYYGPIKRVFYNTLFKKFYFVRQGHYSTNSLKLLFALRNFIYKFRKAKRSFKKKLFRRKPLPFFYKNLDLDQDIEKIYLFFSKFYTKEFPIIKSLKQCYDLISKFILKIKK